VKFIAEKAGIRKELGLHTEAERRDRDATNGDFGASLRRIHLQNHSMEETINRFPKTHTIFKEISDGKTKSTLHR